MTPARPLALLLLASPLLMSLTASGQAPAYDPQKLPYAEELAPVSWSCASPGGEKKDEWFEIILRNKTRGWPGMPLAQGAQPWPFDLSIDAYTNTIYFDSKGKPIGRAWAFAKQKQPAPLGLVPGDQDPRFLNIDLARVSGRPDQLILSRWDGKTNLGQDASHGVADDFDVVIGKVSYHCAAGARNRKPWPMIVPPAPAQPVGQPEAAPAPAVDSAS